MLYTFVSRIFLVQSRNLVHKPFLKTYLALFCLLIITHNVKLFPKQAVVFIICLLYKFLENTVGKGEIALFPQCFLPFWRTFCHFHQFQNCRLQTLSVWKSLKFAVWEGLSTLSEGGGGRGGLYLGLIACPISFPFQQNPGNIIRLKAFLNRKSRWKI